MERWPLAVAALAGLIFWRQRRVQTQRRVARQLAALDRLSGADFQAAVARLLTAQGHRVQAVGGPHDLGVDLIATRGRRRTAVQVKRAARPVARQAISDAVAGRLHYGCEEALVVTNSRFSRDAQRLARSTGCRLAGRETLARWLAQTSRPI